MMRGLVVANASKPGFVCGLEGSKLGSIYGEYRYPPLVTGVTGIYVGHAVGMAMDYWLRPASKQT
jgi:hypothetical protein